MISCPYEKNIYLENSPTNLTIGELRRFSKANFSKWVKEFRKEVVHAWDELGVPITGGKLADGIVGDFKTLSTYDVKKLERPDDLTGEIDCIVNPNVGASCVQFFPTLLKTKDISNGSLDGPSIYKFFADDGYAESFKKIVYNLYHNDPFRVLDDPKARVMDDVRVFRLCFPIRPAVNFPPVVAKYLYLHFTDHIADQNRVVIYDPCAGWGGRILGAMACCNERQVHYVGTDRGSVDPSLAIQLTKHLAECVR